MVLTVTDLIKAQLRLVLTNAGDSDSIDAEEMFNAMQANNMMLDSWSAQRLFLRSLIQQSFSLVANVAAYTIGTGQTAPNFNTAKPIAIPNAFVRDPGGLDYTLDIATEDEFNAFLDKGYAIGVPAALFYDTGLTQQSGVQTGVINIYPYPDQAYTLYIEQQKYLTEFSALTDTLTFEPAYYRALKFNGALEYYHEYRSHKYPVPPMLKQLAKDSKDVITNMNSSPTVARFDLPGVRTGKWNVLTDGYS